MIVKELAGHERDVTGKPMLYPLPWEAHDILLFHRRDKFRRTMEFGTRGSKGG